MLSNLTQKDHPKQKFIHTLIYKEINFTVFVKSLKKHFYYSQMLENIDNLKECI